MPQKTLSKIVVCKLCVTVESRRRPVEDEMVHRMQDGMPPEHRLPPG